jgi:hypothetical protein
MLVHKQLVCQRYPVWSHIKHTGFLWHTNCLCTNIFDPLLYWPDNDPIWGSKYVAHVITFNIISNEKLCFDRDKTYSKYYQTAFVETPSFASLTLTLWKLLIVLHPVSLYVMDGENEESCHEVLFNLRSVCDRNTGIGVTDLWEWGSKLIKIF